MDEFHFFSAASVAEIRKDLLETNDLIEEHRRKLWRATTATVEGAG
jgi:hypothetical protein